MENVVFTNLSIPEIRQLFRQELETYFETNKQPEQPPTEQPEQLLTIQQAAEFLNLTVPTIYSKVSKNQLPVMKRSKRLYFSRTDLMEYVKAGRKKSNAEIEREAEAYLSNCKKGLNNGK
ncbi:MAG: DNA-binding protein [Epsilonproteobacteria bacterium]|nr:DNA-binding protein [Campylobacterota bacterium]